MTTIDNIEDFLRIVREDERVRSAVRRELLTGELLSLPQSVNTLTKSLDELVRRLDRQHEMYRQQHNDFARFRGNYAIDAARQNRYEIARVFAQPRRMRRIEYNALDGLALNALLNENDQSLDALGLSEEALDSSPTADLVIAVTDRRGSSPGFYVAVEASFTAGNNDVRRAAERARILRCATGLDAYAVVASVRLAPNIGNVIFDDVKGFMEAYDRNTAFWYSLVEDDLEPPDPC